MTNQQQKDFAAMVQVTKALIAKMDEVNGRMGELETQMDEICAHPALSVPPPAPPGAIEQMESLDRSMEIAATTGIRGEV